MIAAPMPSERVQRQIDRLLDEADTIRAFIAANAATISRKA